MTAIDDPAATVARNPRREAQEVVGDAFDARVLEPSPPAMVDGDLFADDPDAAVPEPYLYVLPWRFQEAPPSEVWNSTSFRGAILPFGRLVDAADQRTAALDFLRRGRALLEP